MPTSTQNLLFICGIPATGKTRYGDEFAKQFGLVHYDLENEETLNRFFFDPKQFIAGVLGQDRSAVITWGFQPMHQPSVSAVLQLKASGFKLVWLGGDREAALKRFEARAKARSKSDAEYYSEMCAFYLQMYRIEATHIVDTISPVVIDPLNDRQKFKTPTELLQEIRNTREAPKRPASH